MKGNMQIPVTLYLEVKTGTITEPAAIQNSVQWAIKTYAATLGGSQFTVTSVKISPHP